MPFWPQCFMLVLCHNATIEIPLLEKINKNRGFYSKNPKIQPFITKGPRKLCSTNKVLLPIFYIFLMLFA